MSLSKSRKSQNKVMVFGTFDGLHPGHFSFLTQAKKHGNKLIAVVARDKTVRKLKGRKPKQGQQTRLKNIRQIPFVFQAILGDEKQGSYIVIKKYKPNVICLGYDQTALAQNLKQCMKEGLIPKIYLVRLKHHKPKKFHSSIINR